MQYISGQKLTIPLLFFILYVVLLSAQNGVDPLRQK